jgi:hypothetical protein
MTKGTEKLSLAKHNYLTMETWDKEVPFGVYMSIYLFSKLDPNQQIYINLLSKQTFLASKSYTMDD